MVETFLRTVTDWASEEAAILAMGVVGSQARGTARADSDIDLILLVSDPEPFFKNVDWINRFGNVRAFQDEEWGRCRSMRVYYRTGLEAEFGFVSPDWASTDPVDPGTRQVVAGGLRLLYDPESRLSRLAASHEASSPGFDAR